MKNFSYLIPLQEYIQTLEASLGEEMSRHAPLYGVGLESLSMSELDTLSRIHEDGLRQIHLITQQRKGNNNPLVSGHPLPHSSGLYSSAPQVAVGLPPSMIPTGMGAHGNGHIWAHGSAPPR